MKLPFFKKRTSSAPREYLFALEIGQEVVKSAIWSVVNNKTQVLAIGSPVNWDGTAVDQLVQAADRTLSDATTHLDQTGSTQPRKLVLGLPSDWVSEDKISPEKLRLLKELTQKLSLSAIGFVVTPQALVRHLQHVEGVPPTAVLVGFTDHFLVVTLVRLGKIATSQTVSRSSSIPADIIEGLSRFGKLDMLPSRILIYDSATDLESIRQQLLSYPWQAPQNNLPFLHFPKIEVLPPDFSIKAISLSGGSEVAVAIGLIPPEVSAPPAGDSLPDSQVSPEDLGFSSGSDIVTPPPVSDPPPVSPLPKVRRFTLPSVSLPSIRLPKVRMLPAVIVTAVLAVAGLFAAYWYLPQATVTLIVSPKNIQQQFDITADSQITQVDTAGFTLPARTLEVTVSGTSSAAATGTKLVGDRAVGEVTVINGTAVPRTFPAGTTITATGDLKFTFDSAVEVGPASGSADPNSYQPGKANVKVTAAAIGSDSNLTAGTQFRIGTFSSLDFVARNEAALTGGSSRQVAAISKNDLTGLKSQLLDKLKTESREKLSGNEMSDGENIIESSISYIVGSEKFDHEEGDEADKISLDLEVTASTLAYQTDELNQLVESQISSQIPAGYEISGDPQIELSVAPAKEDRIPISVTVSASLIPQIDTGQIAAAITGKYPQTAKDIISRTPNISEISISFRPRLPSILLTLPHQTKNIQIVRSP